MRLVKDLLQLLTQPQKTKHSVEEGFVSILEPFIDTLIICTLTGLVILSSGVWTEKFNNNFERTSMYIIEGVQDEKNNASELIKYLSGEPSSIKSFFRIIEGPRRKNSFRDYSLKQQIHC